MASWKDLLNELNAAIESKGPGALDEFRRGKMQAVKAITGRELLVYATDFLSSAKVNACSGEVMVDLRDKEGFRELVRSVNSKEADVFLFSPGGLAEAAESIVEILRSRFEHVRFIIPMAAKSAATMIALSGNEILMDESGELGPTDPQMIVRRPEGHAIRAPAGAALDQFKQATEKLSKDSSLIPVWLPILREYGPSFLSECDAAIELSKELVKKWLNTYMFAGDEAKEETATTIAEHFATHDNFKSHSRRVGIEELRSLGLTGAQDLRENPKLQEAVWDLQHVIGFTFDRTGAYKLFESTGGAALIRMVVRPTGPPPTPKPKPAPTPTSLQETKPNRAARRKRKKK